MNLKLKEWINKTTQSLSTALVETRDVSGPASIPANSNGVVNFSLPTISGYTYIGIIGIANSHGAHFPLTEFNAEYHRAIVRNLTSTVTTVTLTARLLYVRNVWGVVRKLLKALQTLSLGRGWAA